ncbi:MAG TPA: SRPBCC domain-containing protein [Pseudonocardiaceae bacterium]|nr:SRPBCC domain-containing protein [Pseudonocardiaceae bacterium]
MTVTTPPGKVLRDEAGMRLEFVRTYDRSPEEVWAALTEPEPLARWFGTRTGDPATGTVELMPTDEADSTPQTVTVVECDPPIRLVVDVPSPDGPWPLSVSIGIRDGVTTLVFTHRLAEPYDASNIGPGWHYYLDRLGAVVLDTTVPGNWDDYYPALQDTYALPS